MSESKSVITLREARSMAGVKTARWVDDKDGGDNRTHYSAWEPGETIVVDSYTSQGLAEILHAWSITKLVKPVSLVEFAGRRGYRIMTIPSAAANPGGSTSQVTSNRNETNGHDHSEPVRDPA